MTSTIDFNIRVLDIGSGTIRAFAANVHMAFSTIDHSAQMSRTRILGTVNSVKNLEQAIKELKEKRDGLVDTASIAKANREMVVLQRHADKLKNTGLPKEGWNKLPGWMTNGKLLSGAMSIARKGGEAQHDMMSLGRLTGSKDPKGDYARIQKDAAATPFDVKGMYDANKELAKAGLSAGQARTEVLALGNAVAAAGGGNADLVKAAEYMSALKEAGKASADDIKNLGSVGVNVYPMIAQATGKTLEEAQKMSVSYDLVAYSLQKASEQGGMYAGAMEQQNNSIMGKWEQLTETVDTSLAQIGMSQDAGITALISKLIELASTLPALAQQWSGAISAMLNGLVSFVGMLASMAGWVARNSFFVKLLVGAIAGAYLGFKIATFVTGAYNTIMLVTTGSTVALTTAEGLATVATNALKTAMLGTPWGLIAAAIGAVVGVITALTSASEKQNEIAGLNVNGMDGGVTEERKKRYDTLTKFTANDLNNDHIDKFSPEVFYSRQKYMLQNTAVQNMFQERLDKVDDPALKASMMEHIKDFYKDLLRSPDKVDLVNLKYEPKNDTQVYRERRDKINEFLDGFIDRLKPIPNMPVPGKTTHIDPNATTDVGNSVTGGGQKQVTIKIRSFIEHMVNNIGSGKELVDTLEPQFEEMLGRVLARVPY